MSEIETIEDLLDDVKVTEKRIDDSLALFYDMGLNKDAEEVVQLQGHYKDLTGHYYPEEFNVGYLWNV